MTFRLVKNKSTPNMRGEYIRYAIADDVFEGSLLFLSATNQYVYSLTGDFITSYPIYNPRLSPFISTPDHHQYFIEYNNVNRLYLRQTEQEQPEIVNRRIGNILYMGQLLNKTSPGSICIIIQHRNQTSIQFLDYKLRLKEKIPFNYSVLYQIDHVSFSNDVLYVGGYSVDQRYLCYMILIGREQRHFTIQLPPNQRLLGIAYQYLVTIENVARRNGRNILYIHIYDETLMNIRPTQPIYILNERYELQAPLIIANPNSIIALMTGNPAPAIYVYNPQNNNLSIYAIDWQAILNMQFYDDENEEKLVIARNLEPRRGEARDAWERREERYMDQGDTDNEASDSDNEDLYHGY